MTLNQAKYINRIEAAAAYARALGRDNRVLMGDAIRFFWSQPGITPAPQDASYARIEFHEAAHVLSNNLQASLKSEEIAALYECVYLRGSYKECNQDDESLFFLPVKSMPSEVAAQSFSKRRIENINLKSRPNYEPNYQYLACADFSALYQEAVKDEVFFRSVSGGRALYQLSARELVRLPLVCLGVSRKQAPGFIVERIPDAERQMILDHLDTGDASLLSKMIAVPQAQRLAL